MEDQISRDLQVPVPHVATVIELLDAGNTIPFLARYRKEQTGGLDEEVLRAIEERAHYLRGLTNRKAEVLRLIEEQEALTPELRHALAAATSLQAVEDLYRPFRPKRRTRASIAKEQQLEPLARWLLNRPLEEDTAGMMAQAERYVNPDLAVADAAAALAGARDIVAEMVADNPVIRQWVRSFTLKQGELITKVIPVKGKNGSDPAAIEQPGPYEQYYDYHEAVGHIRPHRVLAINRGEREHILRVRVVTDSEPIHQFMARQIINMKDTATNPRRVATNSKGTTTNSQLLKAAADAYERLLAPAVERDVRNFLTEQAEAQAIKVFAANLKALLLTPPLRGKTVIGLDPAYRTGCKIAVVGPTGSLLANTVIYPTPPQKRVAEAEQTMLALIHEHQVDTIAIGNGTASREAETFVADLLPKADHPLTYVIVNEAGASVYSASPVARSEFPTLEAADRGAVSIARRLQDPLAELVKIEPRAIGVGQYQHDVAGKELTEALHHVVESTVNTVGVNLNTASAPLLAYVAGIGPAVAANIVTQRETAGPFAGRAELAAVPRLGPKTFAQCAGFIRVPDGADPLDNTPIHPESYITASRLLSELDFTVDDVAGVGPRHEQLLQTLATVNIPTWAQRLGIGEPTLTDIIAALQQPGRDPRDELPAPLLRTDILTIDDLTPGQQLQGTVRNVVDFGAFVDIGVQQDGLVHISELSRQYVTHPLDVVGVGDIVNVVILDVNKERNRIALSIKAAVAP